MTAPTRYTGPTEHNPDARYWNVTINLGDGSPVENMGGTTFTDAQTREQVAVYLRSVADRIEAKHDPARCLDCTTEGRECPVVGTMLGQEPA